MDNEVRYLYLDDIIPNRFQPRENFDEQALKELAVSIKEHGVIQPIVVRQIGQKYEIIAGERRYKASTMAGLTKIPAIVRNLDDKESSKVALIENLQRKDLTPIEEARTYQKILELDALTQEELARTMGKSQSSVSNKLRLLTLTDEVQEALLHEQISERHARSLLNVTDPKRQVELLNKIISSRMTVRELDQEIKAGSAPTNVGISNPTPQDSIELITPTINIPEEKHMQQQTGGFSKLFPESSNNTINNRMSETNTLSNLLGTPNVDSFDNEFIDENKLNLPNNTLDNKIDVIGGSGLLAGENTVNTSSVPNGLGLENNLYKNFESSIIREEPKMNTFANNLIEPTIEKTNTIEPNTSNNIGNTIGEIKNVINKLNSNGNKVKVEEFDFDDFYQLVIRIDK